MLGHHYVRYVCPVAVVCLVAWQACSSFFQAERRGATSSCRSLFTVTDVSRRHASNVDFFIQDLQGYLSPHKHSGDWREREPVQSPISATGAVRRLVLKRDSPFGASTADYSPLAALLPSVLTPRSRGEGRAATTNTTRIVAAGGLLPYVPCQMAIYADPASITACFRERLRRQDTLWIFFMGDSKIRILFFEFLLSSEEELHYTLKLPYGTMPLRDVEVRSLKLKMDIEATSVHLPGLLISFQFRQFSAMFVSEMKRSAEVQQLARWASGLEAPPHLLVLGYSAWMNLRLTLRKPSLYLQDVLGFLTDMHEVVIPLLQQISQKTRVLVAAQSRYKVQAVQLPQFRLYSIPYGDPAYDWSEALFLHRLHHAAQQQPPNAPPDESWEKSVKKGAPRDHLVPGAADGGVWWWDTLLPLSLAENIECEELFHSGLTHIPLYNSTFLKCEDNNHAGIITLRDQVTMLLNLACNSLLGEREGLCCG